MTVSPKSTQVRGSKRSVRTLGPTPASVALLAFAMGVLQSIGYDQTWLLWVSMITLSLIGFWGMTRLLLVPSFVTAWSVYGISLALAYGFGALNTMSSGYVDGSAMYMINFAGLHALGRAEGIILLIVAILLYIGHIDPNKTIPIKTFTENERKTALIIVTLVCTGTWVALVTGKLGFQNAQNASEGVLQVSPLSSLMVSCLTPATGLAILAYGGQQNSRARWLVIAMCLALALTQMTQGRRVFMFNILTAMMAFFAVRNARGFFTPKVIVVLLFSLAAIVGASRFFVSMRVAGYNLPADAALSERIQSGWEVLRNPEQANLDERIAENQGTRTFIIGYVGELLQAHEKTGRTTTGDLLKLNIAASMPTAIWPGKWRVIYELGTDEYACHDKLGLPVWDAANSLVTEGLCDFGLIGMLLYPVALVSLMTLANIAVRRTSVVIRALVAFATINSLLGVEGPLAGYIVDLRNTAIIAIVAATLIAVFNRLQQARLVHRDERQQSKRTI